MLFMKAEIPLWISAHATLNLRMFCPEERLVNQMTLGIYIVHKWEKSLQSCDVEMQYSDCSSLAHFPNSR